MQQGDPSTPLAISQLAIRRDRFVPMTVMSPQLPLIQMSAPTLQAEQREELVALVAKLLVGALNAEVADDDR
jgi:hypothetical protein